MEKPSLLARVRYKFDNVLARGTVALIGLLAAADVSQKWAHRATLENQACT